MANHLSFAGAQANNTAFDVCGRKGQNWPIGREIDIIEAVNLVAYNQMALHTQNGCTQPSGVTQSGTTGSTNCTQDAGCTVAENQPNSYGDNFANAGGGVWAAQLDVSGI